MNSIKKSLVVGVAVLAVALAVVAVNYPRTPHAKVTQPLQSIPRPNRQAALDQPLQTVAVAAHLAAHSGAHSDADWEQQFRTSTDRFPLIAKAAKAALKGDGRAAYYVSLKWIECSAMASQYGGKGEPPEQKFNEDIAMWHAPDLILEKRRKQFHDCAGFYNANDKHGNDVFADLPPREGGYRSPKFWMDLAYQEGDPFAEMYRAATDLGLVLTNPVANSAV
jgi:hypothetical protein